jgi:hypothetical protein
VQLCRIVAFQQGKNEGGKQRKKGDPKGGGRPMRSAVSRYYVVAVAAVVCCERVPVRRAGLNKN